MPTTEQNLFTTVRDDYSADIQTTGVIRVGNSTIGVVELSGDRDWFRVSLEEGHRYQIDLVTGSVSDTFLRGIYDAQGIYIEETRNDDAYGSVNSRVTFTPETDGDYFISASAYAHYTGTYSLSISDISSIPVPDRFSEDTSTIGYIELEQVLEGIIDYDGDQDWVRIELTANTNYQIDLLGETLHGSPLHDPFLKGIYDQSGNLIPNTRNDDALGTLNSQLFFTPETTGSYYISAGAFAGVGGYHLSVNTRGVSQEPDVASDNSTEVVVAVGSVELSKIDFAGDQDWFAVSLSANQFYQIDLSGSGDNALRDPYLRGIFDQSETLLPHTQNDDFRGLNSRVVFKPEQDDTYYISAGAFGSTTGAYLLAVKDVTLNVEDLLSNDESLNALLAQPESSQQGSSESAIMPELDYGLLASLLDQAIS